MKKMCIGLRFVFLLLLPLSLIAQKSELYLTVDAQDLAKVKTELAKDAKVHEKVEGGFTSITLAAGLKDKESVVLLVKRGADVQAEVYAFGGRCKK